MTAHLVVRFMDDRGYCASYCCGWRTARKTRCLREQDINAHEDATTPDACQMPR